MKIALGTAQLGLDYGIANTIGKPKTEEAYNIINFAIENGIKYIDTASAYGNSEEIIGNYFSNNRRNNTKIITKIPHFDESEKQVEKSVIQIVKNSMSRLGTKTLDYCLLHNSNNIYSHNGNILNVLSDLKDKGTLNKIGVSVYDPEEIYSVMEYTCIDVIQVPLNIFDQRIIKLGLLDELSAKGIEIHARSIYLQGLLLMDSKDLPSNLKMAEPPLKKLEELANQLNLSKAQLALLFVRDIEGIDRIIIGCETLDQLKVNVINYKLPTLDNDVINYILNTFNDIHESLINPRLWG